MNSVKLYPKVAGTMFYEQFKWSLWFFSFLLAAYIIRASFFEPDIAGIEGFFVFSRYSVGIFLLVCGIMSTYVFMGEHVHHGVTRRDWFKGAAISAFLLTLGVTMLPLLINGIEYGLVQLGIFTYELGSLSAFQPVGGWIAAIGAFFLNGLAYYLIGWLIGIGYYRYGWVAGFGFIGLAIGALSINGYFWNDGGLSEIIPWVPHFPGDAALLTTFVGSAILIAVLLLSMHWMTKRAPIKM